MMIVLLSCAVILLTFLLGVTIRLIIRYRSFYDELTAKQKRFTIAILIPTITKAPGNTVYSGYISYLKKYASFEFETLECLAPDMEAAYKWSEYLASSNLDLIFAAGEVCTRTIAHIMRTRSTHIPIVSGAVPEDVADISFSEMRDFIPLTGTSCNLNWPYKLTLLKEVYPHLKRVTILCRSIDEMSHANLREKNSMTAALRKLHITWEMHHIDDIKRGSDLTEELLKSTDLVIISLNVELMAHTASIASECAKYNVPVVSADLNNPHIFIGISEQTSRLFGTYCAQQTIKILEDGANPQQIKMKKINSDNTIVITPHNAPPLLAATVLGKALEKNTYVRMTVKSK